MASSDAATGDRRFKEYFEEILAIRGGRAPRPVDYDGIYWNEVTSTGRRPGSSGPAVPYDLLAAHAGFSPAELDLLAEARRRSDALAVFAPVTRLTMTTWVSSAARRGAGAKWSRYCLARVTPGCSDIPSLLSGGRPPPPRAAGAGASRARPGERRVSTKDNARFARRTGGEKGAVTFDDAFLHAHS
jgi:hypothetical protein